MTLFEIVSDPSDPCGNPGGDSDGDGVYADNDNCPIVVNPG